MQVPIRCMLVRGGTSKGAYFLEDDLPRDVKARDAILLSLMGSPDARQVDGLGGAHPLTSKVAIVSRSQEPGVDIDFLFAQIIPDKDVVDTTPNCGNILAGIGPFAIERGLIKAEDGMTRVKVRTVNTGTIAELIIETPGREINYEGNARIDGVPGTAAPIPIDFLDVAGSSCGKLLPTGNARDVVDGVELTAIDNGMPVVVMRAKDFGKTGYESPEELEADIELKKRVETIRLKVGPMMNLGDVTKKTVPKMCLVAPPQKGGAISTRNFIPHRVHDAIGVFGAVSVATACVTPGSIAAEVAGIADVTKVKTLEVEHPTGFFTVDMDVTLNGNEVEVRRAALLRTARLLMRGEVMAPAAAWPNR
jgi:4-oxalomesaconate tautomerase